MFTRLPSAMFTLQPHSLLRLPPPSLQKRSSLSVCRHLGLSLFITLTVHTPSTHDVNMSTPFTVRVKTSLLPCYRQCPGTLYLCTSSVHEPSTFAVQMSSHFTVHVKTSSHFTVRVKTSLLPSVSRQPLLVHFQCSCALHIRCSDVLSIHCSCKEVILPSVSRQPLLVHFQWSCALHIRSTDAPPPLVTVHVKKSFYPQCSGTLQVFTSSDYKPSYARCSHVLPFHCHIKTSLRRVCQRVPDVDNSERVLVRVGVTS